MNRWIVSGVTIFALTAATNIYAHTTDTMFAAAQSIIEGWFTAMKDNKPDQAAQYLAPQFVSIHTDGIVRDKKQEVDLIKKLNMKSFNLTDFKFSQSGDVITVTYKDQGTETIDNKAIASKPAGRMAVLQKQGDKWLIIAYANLDKIGS